MKTTPFALTDQLAGLQADCPDLFETLAEASDPYRVGRAVRATRSDGDHALAAVAVLSEN